MTDFNLADEIDRANSRSLRDAVYWQRVGIPIPVHFQIPASVRTLDASLDSWPYRNAYCYECRSRINVTGSGFLAQCGGCRASERQQAREEAAEARREERYDERSDD